MSFIARSAMTLLVMLLTTATAWADGVDYIDETGTPKNTITDGIGDNDTPTPLTGSESTETTELGEGWYVVEGSVNYKGNLSFGGEVHLILADHASLTFADGYGVSYDGSLTIYAQSIGSSRGSLTTGGVFNDLSGTLTINGGTINIDGYGINGRYITINGGYISTNCSSYGYDNFGIDTYLITINGGSVTASGSDMGINASTITINSGNVIASGTSSYGIYATQISLAGGIVKASSYGGTTTIAEGFNYFDGIKSSSTFSVLDDTEILRPVISTSYINKDKSPITDVEAFVLTGSAYTGTTELPGGRYVVTGSNVCYSGMLNFTGDTDLILSDGAVIKINNESALYDNDYGIYTSDALTIYAQSTGDNQGSLTINVKGDGISSYGGKITINGGIIEATGYDDGIDASELTITGGNVTANGKFGMNIYGEININGGNIEATGFNNNGIYSNDGKITITDGIVTANGGIFNNSSSGISITGGIITANGEVDGISSFGDIIIDGGYITATVTGDGTNVGGIWTCGGNIEITGGTVTATGDKGDGIISLVYESFFGDLGGTITISGGTVTASSYNGIVEVADDLAYYDGTYFYSGTLYDGTSSSEIKFTSLEALNTAIGDKTLHPVQVILSETDGITASIATEIAGKPAMFSRTFKAGVASTICLPFPMTSIEGGKVYEFVGVDYDETDGWVATMIDASPEEGNLLSATVANKPYLFKADIPSDKSEGDAVDINLFGTVDSSVSATAAGTTTNTDGDWTFYGTYARLEYGTAPMNGNVYGFAANTNTGEGDQYVAGEFVRAISGASVKAFRAFLTYTGSEESLNARSKVRGAANGLPESITVRLLGKNGEVNGIGTITLSTGEFSTDGWYSLDGRKFDGKPTKKGLYIHNGKKVAIK